MSYISNRLAQLTLSLATVLLVLTAAPTGAQDKPPRQPRPHVLYSARPVYPQIARTAHVQGQVTVVVTVVNGLVTDTQITGVRIPLLERSTADNIKTWRFDPVNTTFTTTFRYMTTGLRSKGACPTLCKFNATECQSRLRIEKHLGSCAKYHPTRNQLAIFNDALYT